MIPIQKYCYSIDGEHYRAANADTKEESALAAIDDFYDAEPGEERIVYVGEPWPAVDILRNNHNSIGESVVEDVDVLLADHVGSEESLIYLSEDKKTELGALIVNFLSEHGGFGVYGVKNITEHKVVIPED